MRVRFSTSERRATRQYHISTERILDCFCNPRAKFTLEHLIHMRAKRCPCFSSASILFQTTIPGTAALILILILTWQLAHALLTIKPYFDTIDCFHRDFTRTAYPLGSYNVSSTVRYI